MKKRKSTTCIAAVTDKKGRIHIAADRRVSWDFSQAQTMPHAKVIKRDGVILAGTGDSYLCDLLTQYLEIPNVEGYENYPGHYVFHPLYNSVKKLLSQRGFYDERRTLKIPREMSVEVLLAVHGQLFTISINNPDELSDAPNGVIQCGQINVPYATGCGGLLAWGSLLTTQEMGMKPKERLLLALNVAAQVSPGCDNIIDIENE